MGKEEKRKERLNKRNNPNSIGGYHYRAECLK